MDPTEDAPPQRGDAFHANPTIRGVPLKNVAPPVDIEDTPPVEAIRSSVFSRFSHTHPMLVPVVLRISPSHDSGPSGFVYLNVHELHDQATIMAYFANAGRVTTVLPCQNFDEVLVLNSLRTRQVSFLSDLPASIVTMGQRILAENAASEEAGPDLSWLPRSPSMTSTSLATLLSHPACSVPRSANISTRAVTGHAPCSSRPDPDGFKAPPPHFFVSVGGQLASKLFPPSPRASPEVTSFPPKPDLPRGVISSPNILWQLLDLLAARPWHHRSQVPR